MLAAVLAITLTYLLADYPYGPVFLSFVVALFLTSLRGHRAAAVAGAIGLYLGLFAVPALLDLDHAPTAGQGLGIAAWLLVVLVVAEAVRFRRSQMAEAARPL